MRVETDNIEEGLLSNFFFKVGSKVKTLTNKDAIIVSDKFKGPGGNEQVVVQYDDGEYDRVSIDNLIFA